MTTSPLSCNLYLAPSTIPNAGLGIFTARELHRGDSVGGNAAQVADDAGDVAIPILDMEWHNAIDTGTSDAPDFPNPLRDYVWNGRALGMDREGGEFEGITTFWPGLDAAINSFAPLVNVERALPEYDTDLQGKLHRSRDPAMGSFSPYVGGNRAYVKHFVPAGGEIFKDYGDAWFLERNMSFPVISDIPKAERLLEHFALRIPATVQPQVHQLLRDMHNIWKSSNSQTRVLRAIPDSWSDTETIVSNFLSKRSTIKEGLRQWYQPNATRSLEWLEENGACLDTIRTGPSTLSAVGGGVGRGAFSTRSFATGEIVATSPLIHFSDRSILDLHEIGADPNDPYKYIRVNKIGTQIAINYCFSHPETTLALCPYGKGINSINHQTSPDKINLRLEWPTISSPILNHNETYLTKPVDEWNTLKPQLAVHYVATRPIAPGDELFLDYGPDWQYAWEQHVKIWTNSELTKPNVPHGQDYVSAEAWNRQHKSNDILWTTDEIENDSSKQAPPFLELRCHTDILTRRRSKYFRLQWEGDWAVAGSNPEYGRPCRVVGRKRRRVAASPANTTVSSSRSHSEVLVYDYDVIVQSIKDFATWGIEDVKRYNVPRRLLKWFDQPHTTDLHLFLAFRHFLGLPDSLVSKEWRNKMASRQSDKPLSVAAMNQHLHEPVLPPGYDIDTKAKDAEACPASVAEESSETQQQQHRMLEDDLARQGIPATAEPDEHPHNNVQCDLYLAPSSIPGAGLGIFTGKSMVVGDMVGSGDVAIPVFGMATEQDFFVEEGASDGPFDDEMFENPFERYVWDVSSFGLGQEGSDDVGLFWPGINAAVNCYPALINLQLSMPGQDTAGVHRYRHPGAGAFSPYHKGRSQVTRYIPTGGELFKDYGKDYFLTREDFDGVPVVVDFDQAHELLGSFFQFSQESGLDTKSHLQPHVYNTMRGILRIWNDRVTNALPDTFDSAKYIMEALDGDIGKLHQPNRTREISWLDTNGRCIDHIVPQRSTLEGAGRGAFAKRFLPKGTILTGSPLIHVRRQRLIRVPRNATAGEKEAAHSDLILNYCFGDAESSLLLCPYSSGVNYINHNRTLANVRVQWAAHGTMGQDNKKFEIPPWHFDYSPKPSMAFDYIVTKDIEPNEEIFLDYGEDYEIAWNRHVAEWKPQPEWESYMAANDFNQVVAKEKFIRTANEQEHDPYPGNLILHCHSTLVRYSIHDLLDRGVDMQDAKHMQGVFPWYEKEGEGEEDGAENGFPCKITNRRSSDGGFFLYDVIITVPTDSVPSEPFDMERTGVPRHAMRFFDRFKSTDIHLESSFRHAIGIPKEMIPSAWKDLVSSRA